MYFFKLALAVGIYATIEGLFFLVAPMAARRLALLVLDMQQVSRRLRPAIVIWICGIYMLTVGLVYDGPLTYLLAALGVPFALYGMAFMMLGGKLLADLTETVQGQLPGQMRFIGLAEAAFGLAVLVACAVYAAF